MKIVKIRAGRLRLIALGVVLALQGCQGMYLHQPDRAAVAATAKKQMDSVDIGAVSKAERENVARMTAEEIKAVDARKKAVAQLAAIQLSSDSRGIETHYSRALSKVRGTLGTAGMLDLKRAGDCRLRRENSIEQLLLLERQFRLFGIEKPPACTVPMAPVAPPPELPEPLRSAFDTVNRQYGEQCAVFADRACDLFDKNAELATAQMDAKRRKLEAQAAAQALAQARKAYTDAVASNKSATDKASNREKELREKAQKLVDAVDTLAKVAPGEADKIKSSALIELLGAAASGTAPDGETSAAVEIARSVPSLVQSIEQARAAAAQIPVSHLLLALNNQVILAGRNNRLAALDDEELGFLQAKVQAREKQAELWRHYSDSLCKLVVTASGADERSGACDTIVYAPATAAAPAKCVLKFERAATLEVPNCVLAQSWRDLFRNTPGKPMARRYLHEAAAAYLQVRLNAYDTSQEELRRLDVLYRRTIVEREASLEQWKNLVAVPAAELEAYYAGGTKPAEIADLLIKALGLTAIAVGVSK